MKRNAETEMFQGDDGRNAVKPNKKNPFYQDSHAHGSYSALLDLRSETVKQTIVMNSHLKFATHAHGDWGAEKWVL